MRKKHFHSTSHISPCFNIFKILRQKGNCSLECYLNQVASETNKVLSLYKNVLLKIIFWGPIYGHFHVSVTVDPWNGLSLPGFIDENSEAKSDEATCLTLQRQKLSGPGFYSTSFLFQDSCPFYLK